jgi:hypothetical protein
VNARHSVLQVAAMLLAGLTGCATFVESKKTSKNAAGIEYSLPVPFIYVTPQPDGTMLVNVEYLPDPANRYVLRTGSFMSSYTLDVQRENGMLKSVTLVSKSDALAASLAESAGNVVKTRADATLKADEAAAAEREARAKALSDAQVAVDVARAKLGVLEAENGSSDMILQAKLALAEAEQRLAHLQSVGRGALTGGNIAGDGTAANLAAAGPVLFRVVPDQRTGGVRLVAAEGPSTFPTSVIARPAERNAPDLNIRVVGSAVIPASPGGPLQFVVVANKQARRVRNDEISFKRVGSSVDDRRFIMAANLAPSDEGAEVVVTLDPDTPPGSYQLELPLEDLQGQPMLPPPVLITVVSE